MDARPGESALTVEALRKNGSVTFTQDISIRPAGYILQEFHIPENRLTLVTLEAETVDLAFIDAKVKESVAEPLWGESGFELPLDSELNSPFGAYRLLNGTLETRHTGWDQRAAVGTPVRAMAAGIVAAARTAGNNAIRGNYVLIDHGVGVISGYAHLSEMLVSAGQRVDAGQIIGLSGNTGRSSAPHLHWELLVHGEWADGRRAPGYVAAARFDALTR